MESGMDMSGELGCVARAEAVAALGALVARLGLDTYTFAVRPRRARCEVHVEYEAEDGWKGVSLPVSPGQLSQVLAGDEGATRELLREWRSALHHGR